MKVVVFGSVLLSCVAALRLIAVEPPAPPQPYGPAPSAQQLQWHEMEFYGLIHFGMNTFANREWGLGDESPELFNPTAFDSEQIVSSAKAAGMRGLILVCKHHDGFCLWPSKYTEHSVKHSPWQNGSGDVVKEVSEACRKQGLQFGVYLSPWDRNHKDYGRPEYVTYYRNLLRELLTNYGEVFVAWFDGACGGDGYYGGARAKRQVDARTYYGWPETWSLVRQLQPSAVIFSDAGPDVRWVGNESGVAGDPCWATADLGGSYPGMINCPNLTTGSRSGTNWAPAECDVALRPLWFYHAHDDMRVKSVVELVNLYYQSVGRGAALDLGLAPDRRGLLADPDVAALREMGRMINVTFATNLAATAKLVASNVRGARPSIKQDAVPPHPSPLPREREASAGQDLDSERQGPLSPALSPSERERGNRPQSPRGVTSPATDRFSPANLLDGDRDTYWATDDGVTTPELVFTWNQPVTFNVVRLREHLPLGQRVDAFALDEWHALGQSSLSSAHDPQQSAGLTPTPEGEWREFARASSIGNQRLIRTPLITTEKVRLRITQAAACPALSEFGLYAEPEGFRPAPFRVPVAEVKAEMLKR